MRVLSHSWNWARPFAEHDVINPQVMACLGVLQEGYVSQNTLMTTVAYHGALDGKSGELPMSQANVSLAEFRHWAAVVRGNLPRCRGAQKALPMSKMSLQKT